MSSQQFDVEHAGREAARLEAAKREREKNGSTQQLAQNIDQIQAQQAGRETEQQQRKKKEFLDLYALSIDSLQDQHAQSMKTLRTQHAQGMDNLRTQHTQKIEDTQAQHDQSMNDVQTQHKENLDQLQAQHDQSMNDVQTQHKKSLDQLQAEHDQSMATLRNQHAQNIKQTQARLENDARTQAKTAKTAHALAVEQQKQSLERNFDDRFRKVVDALKESNKKAVARRDEDVAGVRDERNKLREEIETLRMNHSDQINELVTQHEMKYAALKEAKRGECEGEKVPNRNPVENDQADHPTSPNISSNNLTSTNYSETSTQTSPPAAAEIPVTMTAPEDNFYSPPLFKELKQRQNELAYAVRLPWNTDEIQLLLACVLSTASKAKTFDTKVLARLETMRENADSLEWLDSPVDALLPEPGKDALELDELLQSEVIKLAELELDEMLKSGRTRPQTDHPLELMWEHEELKYKNVTPYHNIQFEPLRKKLQHFQFQLALKAASIAKNRETPMRVQKVGNFEARLAQARSTKNLYYSNYRPIHEFFMLFRSVDLTKEFRWQLLREAIGSQRYGFLSTLADFTDPNLYNDNVSESVMKGLQSVSLGHAAKEAINSGARIVNLWEILTCLENLTLETKYVDEKVSQAITKVLKFIEVAFAVRQYYKGSYRDPQNLPSLDRLLRELTDLMQLLEPY